MEDSFVPKDPKVTKMKDVLPTAPKHEETKGNVVSSLL